MRFQSVDVEDGVMELKIRSDSKAPLDKLTECEVAINVVNKNLSFGSTYVDDGGMIRFRYPYIFSMPFHHRCDLDDHQDPWRPWTGTTTSTPGAYADVLARALATMINNLGLHLSEKHELLGFTI